MATEIFMPKLGLTMTEGTIDSWKKNVGDTVQKGEIILSVETDKLTNDVEADTDGVLLKILVPEGETVPCKTVIGWIGAAGEAVPDAGAPAPAAAPETPAAAASAPAPAAAAPAARAEGEYVLATPYAKKLAKEKGFDLARIPATGYKGVVVARDVEGFVPSAASTAAEAVKASPLAAKVAADLGIDLKEVKAAHGRILAEDLLRYISETREKAEAGADAAEREEVKPMSGMRKAIAKNMLNSHMTSPTVTFNLGIDMTEMKRYREQLKAKEIKVSYTDLLVKFVAKALTEFPLLNCSVEDNKIIYKHYVNMGVAVALDNGLVVPNITDADKKSLTEISAEVKELAKLAREGKLPPEKLSGGTFTITNLGMYGIESFSPIINQPEVAILGVNTMEDKVVVRNGEICIRPIMNLSLTADHRVVDGSVAAQFLQRVKSLMENPALILA
ncbi:MAG: 2-oxo acid dehydrogenase subunit E2 [Oscillospiraceae bacterium]|nr:2-oxo acid dehydrogenase subunit E2 [Oscillospiraceae bacterium]